MSINYSLDIATAYQPTELLKFLVETCGFVEVSEKVVKKDEVIVSAYVPSNTGAKDELGHSIFQRAYGFDPSVSVNFQPSNSSENFTFHAKHITTLQSVITVLNHFSGKAVLLWNYEQTVLRRLNGDIEIDVKWYEGVSIEGFSPDNVVSLASPLL
jgi:hypothetical protein